MTSKADDIPNSMEILKGYRIIEQIGKGGMATTYRAEQIQTKRQVAIKVLSLQQATEWKVIELFEREAKVLASLKHPAIPAYIDYFTEDSERDRYFYLVQELAVGVSLDKLTIQGREPKEEELKQIAIQILEVLIYLHSLNPPVIHRDIKPANIIYQPDSGKVYLVDFGAVQDTYRNTFTRGGTFVGTFGFMAPEQYRGDVSFATDLYGLGATLVYLLTGQTPSELPQKRMKIDWKRSAIMDLSDDFANWLDSLLEPIPEDRAVSASAALAVLLGEKSSSFALLNPPPFKRWKVSKTRDRFFAKSRLTDYPFKVFLKFFVPSAIALLITMVLAFSTIFNSSFVLMLYIPFAIASFCWLVYAFPNMLWNMISVILYPYLTIECDRQKFRISTKILGFFPFTEIWGATEHIADLEIEAKTGKLILWYGIKKYEIGSGYLGAEDKIWLHSELWHFLK
jgi:eukaryotic-like serine/threonine-protein kinase